MTMQLMSHAYTTTSTKKRKNKPVTINAKYAAEFREHNKFMRRIGCKEKSLDEYIQYRQGNYKPALKGTPMPKYEISNHREKYPSGDGIGTTYARKENVYTGTLIKGIATMHKSNAVPIINNEQAIEVATMRRS
jgi:hypothetical protein